MDTIRIAIIGLYNYIAMMHIDLFAIPVLTGKGIDIVLFNAHDFADFVRDTYEQTQTLPNSVILYSGENFFRLSTVTSANKIELPHIFKRYHTSLKKYSDIPLHHNMQARGFEILTAQYTSGQHTGDNISEIDVIADIEGKPYRIECGIKKKKMVKQTRIA